MNALEITVKPDVKAHIKLYRLLDWLPNVSDRKRIALLLLLLIPEALLLPLLVLVLPLGRQRLARLHLLAVVHGDGAPQQRERDGYVGEADAHLPLGAVNVGRPEK